MRRYFILILILFVKTRIICLCSEFFRLDVVNKLIILVNKLCSILLFLEFFIEDMSNLCKVTEEKLQTLNISEEEEKLEKGKPSERTKDNGEEAIARSKDDGDETSVRSKDDNEPVENEQPEYTYGTRNGDAKTLGLESEDSDAVSKILLLLIPSCFINPQLVPSQLQASLT